MSAERNLSVEFLKAAMCGLTEVVHTNQGFEVNLPQIYHTGHGVSVIVRPDERGYMIHDNSYAAMLLSGMGIAVTGKLLDTMRPQVASYGCELTDARVWRSATLDNIAVAATLVGCASRLIADYALRTGRPAIFDFKSTVLGKVVGAVGQKRVRTNEEVKGHRGSTYRVSTVVLDEAQSKPVAFVEPIADREAVPRRFKEFYDLSRNPVYDGVDRVAVYDEKNPIPSGDALLLQEVGNLVRFSDAAARFNAWTTH